MNKKVSFWEFFQGLGKTFMLPVSLLAACGIMLGIGSSFASSITAEILPFLKIPGDIYVLSELKVILDPLDYLYVYGISLAWVLIIGFFVMRKLKSGSVLAGLRQEFS